MSTAIIHVKDSSVERYTIPGSKNPRERWTAVNPDTALERAKALASLEMGNRYDFVRLEVDGVVVFEARRGREVDPAKPAAPATKPKARKTF